MLLERIPEPFRHHDLPRQGLGHYFGKAVSFQKKLWANLLSVGFFGLHLNGLGLRPILNLFPAHDFLSSFFLGIITGSGLSEGVAALQTDLPLSFENKVVDSEVRTFREIALGLGKGQRLFLNNLGGGSQNTLRFERVELLEVGVALGPVSDYPRGRHFAASEIEDQLGHAPAMELAERLDGSPPDFAFFSDAQVWQLTTREFFWPAFRIVFIDVLIINGQRCRVQIQFGHRSRRLRFFGGPAHVDGVFVFVFLWFGLRLTWHDQHRLQSSVRVPPILMLGFLHGGGVDFVFLFDFFYFFHFGGQE